MNELLLRRILRGESDGNVPFHSLRSLLKALGFTERIKGSHYIFSHDGIRPIINLQPEGSNAKRYQVRQIRRILLEHKLGKADDE